MQPIKPSPIVSVIMPAYNSEKYIREAVQSILDQTFKDFELIIINDASTDNTRQIIESIADSRIRLVNNDVNLRVVKSLNKGLGLAKGKFIARMDADDISLPQRFERQVEYLLNNDVDICSSYVEVFGNQNYVLRSYHHHDDIKASLLFLNTLIHPSLMFKKDKFIEHHINYDESFVNAEDYWMWVNIIDKLKFAIIPQLLFRYRVHDSNVSIKKDSNWSILKQINFRVYKKILQNANVPFTTNDLNIHIHIGFKDDDKIAEIDYVRYLNWFERITLANNQSNYFNHSSLRNQMFHHLMYVTKNSKLQAKDYYLLIKTLFNLYTLQDFSGYLQNRIWFKLKMKTVDSL